MRLLFVLGTRPEAIKLAPVIRAARERASAFEAVVCVTGQHREMVAPFLELFELRPDFDLAVMRPDASLSGLVARLLDGLDAVLADVRPDAVVVQGDAATAMAGALAAFHRRVPVAHVEAGLRSGDLAAPFPEELYRVIAGRVAGRHFAPTPRAARNLYAEGVPEGLVHVTGNTVVDAVRWVRDHRLDGVDPAERRPSIRGRRLVLVTGHRRESFGAALSDLCLAVRDVVESEPDAAVVWPVHLNPNVREPVARLLGPAAATGRLVLEEPVDYPTMIALLRDSYLVVTDSGGIQEEAPEFGRPVLVARETTERPEGVEAGVARLVGTARAGIVSAIRELLHDPAAYARMARHVNPYGDGLAAGRILDALAACGSDPR
ncbi:MAG: UDP-N-acetylglucosamine 2-epimerase (non-hydrolyzing) [Deltaproteobacteria bacterium]|nr:UDP-N-acetylglucosamine 2-epimerase (non-hydrolyzing) [Deltaproteobacteria bacterium]